MDLSVFAPKLFKLKSQEKSKELWGKSDPQAGAMRTKKRMMTKFDMFDAGLPIREVARSMGNTHRDHVWQYPELCFTRCFHQEVFQCSFSQVRSGSWKKAGRFENSSLIKQISDTNPIEHVWSFIKLQICRQIPPPANALQLRKVILQTFRPGGKCLNNFCVDWFYRSHEELMHSFSKEVAILDIDINFASSFYFFLE